MSTQIIIGELSGTIALAPDAEAIRATALAKAEGLVAPPTNAEELAIFADARRGLHDIVKGVGKTYDILNRPILDEGIKLRALRDGYLAPIAKREEELDGFINFYQRKQMEAQREAEATAERARHQAETDRLAAEKKAAKMEADALAARQREKKAIADAETARLALEAANSPEAKAKAAQEAADATARQQAATEAAAKLAAKLATEQQAAQEEAEMAAMVPVPVAPVMQKVKGIGGKFTFDYEIIGAGNDYKEQESLAAFSRAYPHLVKYEIRRASVLDVLNGPGFKEPPPGLKIVEKVKSNIR